MEIKYPEERLMMCVFHPILFNLIRLKNYVKRMFLQLLRTDAKPANIFYYPFILLDLKIYQALREFRFQIDLFSNHSKLHHAQYKQSIYLSHYTQWEFEMSLT